MTKELQDQLDAASIVVADGKGGFYAMLHKSDVEEIVESIAPDNSELLDQLNNWISSCKARSEIFVRCEMPISETSSMALANAYQNVLTFIQNAQSK